MSYLTRVLGAVAVALTISAAPALAGDIAKGKRIFNKCKACHAVDKPKNKIGPHLMNVLGRSAGEITGFKYSKSMLAANLVWDKKTLDRFLTKPKSFLKGTKMAFRGLKKPADRENVIAYLQSLTAK
ncbi:MAG: cytochrome c family protein [Alphaproteobacteria bacterium]|nr:cytochrome c family protein [Alphaproteobacteria bacterium]